MRAWREGSIVLLALGLMALPSAAADLHPGHEQEPESPGVMPQVGQKAPDVQLAGSDGKGHWLRSYRGKKAVVLAFFPKANSKG
jgi:AhpC/TSA family